MSTSQKNPLVLVHGITDTYNVFGRMCAYLTAWGWSVHTLNLSPNDGSENLENLAQQIANYINHVFPGNKCIDLLGFSMGGLVTRYYLQRLGGIEKVQRYISISAPNHGTVMAYLLPFSGVSQMRPNSQFLHELNQDYIASLSQIKCTTIWTPLDLMIVPASSSNILVGKQIRVPVLLHAWMLKDPRVLAIVREALSEPLPPG